MSVVLYHSYSAAYEAYRQEFAQDQTPWDSEHFAAFIAGDPQTDRYGVITSRQIDYAVLVSKELISHAQ